MPKTSNSSRSWACGILPGWLMAVFSRLNEYVAYWTTPAMLALIQKHQAYLIVNIGNEAATGDEDAPAHLTAYANAYTKAVQQLRLAGDSGTTHH